jgi:hypothetical protein
MKEAAEMRRRAVEGCLVGRLGVVGCSAGEVVWVRRTRERVKRGGRKFTGEGEAESRPRDGESF